MADNQKQNYLHGAAILAVGIAVIKLLGAVYKIPLANIIGDVAYGHFLVAYNIYNVFLTIATAGFPVALSRMISEADTLGRPMQAKRIFSVSLALLAVIGAISSVIMFIFPTELAAMMHDVKASQSIWALSPCVLFVCVLAAYRGHTQGHGNMKPTAISQIIEVVAKIIVGLSLAIMLTRMGKSEAITSAGATFGVTAGGLAALIYLVVSKHRNHPARPVAKLDVPDNRKRILYDILKIGIPITLGSSVLSVISLIDGKLILDRLQNALGYTDEYAVALYGVYGKAQTLFNLAPTIITAVTIAIVPAIVAALTKHDRKEADRITNSSLRISSLIAMPMAAGLTVLSFSIMNVLYPGSNEAGVGLLAIMGIDSFFVCLALVTNAVLQAYGGERYPVYSMIVGGVVKIAVNWVLVSIPEINIYGAPIGTFFCYFVMCIMNYFYMRRKIQSKLDIRAALVRPFISTVLMAAAAWGVYEIAARVLGSGSWIIILVELAAAIVIAVAVYLVAIVKTRAITMEDMRLIPKGEKLGKLLRIKEGE